MSELTYRHVGSTRREDLLGHPPAGYRPIERRIVLGRGAALFERAADEVLTFGIQRRSGLRPVSGAGLADGSRAVRVGDRGVLRLGPLRLPLEVVDVVDEPRRRGFAYGTRRGHPESGEELFLVEHRRDDSVELLIRAFSRPAHPVLRLGSPLLLVLQERYTRRYERALLPLASG